MPLGLQRLNPPLHPVFHNRGEVSMMNLLSEFIWELGTQALLSLFEVFFHWFPVVFLPPLCNIVCIFLRNAAVPKT